MTVKAIEQITHLVRKVLFTPVTTRTVEQYQRIALFQEFIKPKYAVTSNGGNILIHGVPDSDWNRHVRRLIQHESLPLNDILEQFNQITRESWFVSGRIADDLFYYCIVKRELLPEQDILFLGRWAKKSGWHLSIQGRKVYLVPEMVSKGKALQYIREREQVTRIVAAGDSLLDLDMLLYADYALVPPHGEIYRSVCEGLLTGLKLNFTVTAGIHSSEEILERAADYLSDSYLPLFDNSKVEFIKKKDFN